MEALVISSTIIRQKLHEGAIGIAGAAYRVKSGSVDFFTAAFDANTLFSAPGVIS